MEMPGQDVNFLYPNNQQNKPNASFPGKQKKGFVMGRVFINLFIIILIAGMAYSTRAVIATSNLSGQFGDTSLFQQFKHLVSSEDKPLKGEEEDRINVLLLGVGGEGHQGGELTDTIILASLRPSTKKISLLSIPRDLVAPSEGVGWQKINSANTYGANLNPEDKDAGPRLAVNTVAKITGLPIHYYVKMNFAGFVKLIDTLDGVRVYVPQSFTDYQYPDENFGYNPVHFDSGWQDLDGDRALQYVRSRHGGNGEGSDFARADRQQNVLRAIQIKTLALSTLLNPGKIISLSEVVGKNIKTDMELWESFKIFDLAKRVNSNEIKQIVLSNGNQGLLSSYIGEDGAYLLRPRLGVDNFSEIQAIAANMLAADSSNDLVKIKPLTETSASPRLAIQNGTTYPGLARTAANKLSQRYQIIEIGNAPTQNYETTVVYNLTNIDDEKLMPELTKILGVSQIDKTSNGIKNQGADLLIILGADSIPAENREPVEETDN